MDHRKRKVEKKHFKKVNFKIEDRKSKYKHDKKTIEVKTEDKREHKQENYGVRETLKQKDRNSKTFY